MPEKAPAPLALQWAVFIREHGVDLKLSKEARALGLALITYGEGKKIFATMVTLSRVTGMKRETVRNARRELQDKGLLEDITRDPDKQERTYRLSMPGYVDSKVVPERTTPGPLEDHPLVPERITPGPLEDHDIKLVDREIDQYSTSTSPAAPDGDGDDSHPSTSTQSQNQETLEPDWMGDGQEATANRDHLAGLLHVPLGSIGSPLWRWLEDLGSPLQSAAWTCGCRCQVETSGECQHDGPCPCPCPTSGSAEECTCTCECGHRRAYYAYTDAVNAAARKAAGAGNPIGYFQAILPGYIERYRAAAEAEATAARAEAEALAAEAEAAQERAEREAAARDEILSLGIFRDGYLPTSVRRGVSVRPKPDRPGMLPLWHHSEHGLTILSIKADLNPGPGWEFVYARMDDAERAKRIPLRAV